MIDRWGCRFVNFDDKEWFDGAIKRVCGSEIGAEYVEKLNMEPYFVDFLRDAPEPTGDEPDDFEIEAPKIYETVRCHLITSFSLISLF